MDVTPVTPPERRRLRPNPGPQERFLATAADIAVYGGARGGGKTWALLLEPLRHVGRPRFSCVIFRRTYPEITQARGIWQESLDLYPGTYARARLSDLEYVWPSGARVKFAHLQHATDLGSWKGAQIALLELDQAEEFTEEMFWFLLTTNRSTAGVRPYVRLGCNPVLEDDPVGGWLHRLVAWWIGDDGYPVDARSGVLRWFVRDPSTDELIWSDSSDDLRERFPLLGSPRSLTFIPARLEDNPPLDRGNPDYRAMLMQLPRVERLRHLAGNWKIRAAAGLVFDRSWFELVDAAPVEATRVRYWDKAGTEAGGDWSAGVRLSRTREGLWFVEDVVRGRWSAGERNRVIRQVAESDGHDVEIWLEQEPGSGGKESAEISVRELAGWVVRTERVTGEKLARAGPLSAQAEAGNVKLVRGSWCEAFLRELYDFPDGTHDDQVDAAAGAFNQLARHRGDPVIVTIGGPTKASEISSERTPEELREAREAVESRVRSQGMYWPER